MLAFDLKVFAVVFVLLGQVSWAVRLPVTPEQKLKIHEWELPAIEWVRKQIAQFPVPTSAEDIGHYLKETRRVLRETKELPAGYEGRLGILSDLLYQLIYLTEGDNECHFTMVHYYIKMIQHVFGSLAVMGESSEPSHDANLFNFLKYYGRIEFTGYARNYKANVDMDFMLEQFPDVARLLHYFA